MIGEANALRELQSATGEELSALLPSVLRPSGGAFKGELRKATPFPSFPQIQSADLGEGELRVGMKKLSSLHTISNCVKE